MSDEEVEESDTAVANPCKEIPAPGKTKKEKEVSADEKYLRLHLEPVPGAKLSIFPLYKSLSPKHRDSRMAASAPAGAFRCNWYNSELHTVVKSLFVELKHTADGPMIVIPKEQ